MTPARSWSRGWIFALIATAIYSTNAPIARGAILAGMDPNALVFGRFVLGNLLFALTLTLTDVAQPQGEQHKFDRRGLVVSLGAGMINGLMLLAGAWGLVDLSASIATLLSIAVTPLFVMGLLRIRGERPQRRDLLRLAIGLLGLYFLIGLDGGASGRGVLLTAFSAFLYALHMVIVQWFLRPYNRWMVTATLIFGASLPAGLLWWQMGASLYIPGAVGWLALIVQGIAATFVARILIYEAVNRIGSAQIALLTPLEAALTVLWSMLWLAELVTARQSVGILLILLSTVLAAQLPGFMRVGVRKLPT
ncbi:MAG: DMT family transporter [Caldilineaceae bacterium]